MPEIEIGTPFTRAIWAINAELDALPWYAWRKRYKLKQERKLFAECIVAYWNRR